MHLIDLDVKFMGATAIVGNTIPVGVGIGESIAQAQSNNISVIFLGMEQQSKVYFMKA